VQDETRAPLAHQHPRFQHHLQLFVIQRQIEIINGLRETPLDSEVGRHLPRQAEQDLRLIYQVGAEVVQNPAAFALRFPPRVRPWVISEAVVTRLEFNQATQEIFAQHSLHGLEVAVPPPIMVDAEKPVLPSRQIDQLPGLLGCGRKRFFDHDVLTG
jgi:hypothetical protein